MWTGGFLLRQAVQSRHCEGDRGHRDTGAGPRAGRHGAGPHPQEDH